MNKLSQYEMMSAVFDFPDQQYPKRVQAIVEQMGESYPKAVAPLQRFMELLPVQDTAAMQELFIRSFDVQSLTTLDIGYIMFGDDYKRGELLANLNREHLKAKNDCGHELADHLPNVLRLMAKWEDAELLDDLVQIILVPALRTMLDEFSPERVEKKKKSYEKHYKTLLETPDTLRENLYLYALQALYEMLKKDFSLLPMVTPEASNDFLKSIQREIEIEETANQFY